jgi:uncharacterized membrane protein
MQHVAAGTPGAVSMAGTCAGLVAALLMALLSHALLPGGWLLVAGVVIGTTIGAFVESALATTFEADGVLNNDLLNFINTAVAAAAATGVASVVVQLLDRA